MDVEVITAGAQQVQLLRAEQGGGAPDAAATAGLSQREHHRPCHTSWCDMDVCRSACNVCRHDGGFHLARSRINDHDAGCGGGGVHWRNFLGAGEGRRKDVVRHRAVNGADLVDVRSGGSRVDRIAIAAAACQRQQR